jgi:hypothetical protein
MSTDGSRSRHLSQRSHAAHFSSTCDSTPGLAMNSSVHPARMETQRGEPYRR